MKLNFTINDPIYGYINIQHPLIIELINHPYFQRLRRIRQMALLEYTFAGATHNRFQHTLGTIHLLQKALDILMNQGIKISNKEYEACLIAMLLHDIGHGPFSHTLEGILIPTINHEAISVKFMENLNLEFKGRLSVAIDMFTNKYPRHFFNQLISSQVDMDRMDFLMRDSYVMGLKEFYIAHERILYLMTVVDDKIVFKENCLISLENFLITRFNIFWQIYNHKNCFAIDSMLVKLIKRAQFLIKIDASNIVDHSTAIYRFLSNNIDPQSTDFISDFSQIDDYDIIGLIKLWQHHPDFVLRTLAVGLLNRQIFSCYVFSTSLPPQKIQLVQDKIIKKYKILPQELDYLCLYQKVSNILYPNDKLPILILSKDGSINPITELGFKIIGKNVSKLINKYYFCHIKI